MAVSADSPESIFVYRSSACSHHRQNNEDECGTKCYSEREFDHLAEQPQWAEKREQQEAHEPDSPAAVFARIALQSVRTPVFPHLAPLFLSSTELRFPPLSEDEVSGPLITLLAKSIEVLSLSPSELLESQFILSQKMLMVVEHQEGLLVRSAAN
jgi:hypothetical protein